MQAAEPQHRPPARRQPHPFDSLAYAKSMESVGFTRQQAEKMAEEQAKLIDERLATKEDIEFINANMQAAIERTNANIEALRISTKADIETTRAVIETTAERTKAEILKWMFGTVAGQTVILLGAMIGILRGGVH